MFKRMLLISALAAIAWRFLKRRRHHDEGVGNPAKLPPSIGPPPEDMAAGYAPSAAEHNAPAVEDRYRPAAQPAGFTGSPVRTPDTGPYQPPAVAPAQPDTGDETAPPAGRASEANGGSAAAAAGGLPARPIKGNEHGGKRLYHLPDDEGYDQVIEERRFATPEEAEAAGYRRAGAAAPSS
jgi:hypothetical protein